MLVDIRVAPGQTLIVTQKNDGSAIVTLPDSVIRQAYCDLVAAEVETSRLRKSERALAS